MLLSKAHRLNLGLRNIPRLSQPLRLVPQRPAQVRFVVRPAKQTSAVKTTKNGVEIPSIPRNKSRNKKIFWSVLGASTVFGIIYTAKDDETSLASKATNIATTLGRIGVVTVATVKCFYLYKVLLGKKFDSEEEENAAFSETHLKAALITRKALEKNAGIFIKLGQHISALTYLFPPEWTETMIPLQDCCPVSSIESIDEMMKEDLGVSLQEEFVEFDPVPLGTASLAQVHRARLRSTGEEVAVKFQHPSLKEFVPLDVLMTRTVFAIMDYIFPEYPMVWLADEMQESIYVELDFTNEARNSKKTSDYFKEFYSVTALRIPDVYSANPRVMVMEFLGGGRPDDLAFLDKHKISRADLSSCFAHIFNNMIFTPNVGLHCDPHAGNIAIRPLKNSKRNYEIILYDHGLYRDVPTDVRRSYAHFWLALIDKNESDMRKYAKEFAGISDDQFKLFSAAITGRDFENAVNNVVSKRSHQEIENMASSIATDGLLSQIMLMLHSMPRIVLLILKTNDLTRYLDEKLDSPLGVERTFLIMASYCAKTVYEEGREKIICNYNLWSLSRWAGLLSNWWRYFKRQQQLFIYDSSMYFRNLL
ncbi:hypothetical protein DV495_001914 [Geotrichum candidum]|uniref:ABC1 atypical kinase-like domain-containing protein n=1 Tax=Geotrichum candidum TaxID=1173061 RepID=A0A0J9XLC5_GEOCN|nr:hypothetical protein DV495_001914 [Geotrichum candidum]KAF7498517.1 hypothetical protein DV113_003470 [Geotrichum candidum]KAI8133147.1 hypothetical protein DUD61_003203 [Geotrichum candidum]KAI9211276.1 hypothetical protein DS838_003841 [Geotrichum bryndzae]CDO57955.1 similar to Saccharomyces cerevisiae YLR253W MCP2 Putative protein of unknown function [Geotrichum candidum]